MGPGYVKGGPLPPIDPARFLAATTDLFFGSGTSPCGATLPVDLFNAEDDNTILL